MSKGLEFRRREHPFLRLCSIEFDTTRHILKVLRRYRRKDVRYYLIFALVVSYARPFSKNSEGGHSRQLGEKNIVPPSMRPLHDELMRRRNEQFAHTALDFRKPQIKNWGTAEKPWFPMAIVGEHYELLDARIHEIEELAHAVEANLNERIRLLEQEIAQGESASPAKD